MIQSDYCDTHCGVGLSEKETRLGCLGPVVVHGNQHKELLSEIIIGINIFASTCEFIAVIARDFKISRAFWFDRILFTFFSWGFNFFCLPAGLIFCIRVLKVALARC